jgi:hypothetical protein
VKENAKDKSLAMLTDAYLSPLLLNTLVRDGIPAAARGGRLKEEFRRFCGDLRMLDKADALNIIAQPESRLLINSEDFLPCLIDHLDQKRAEGIRVFRDRLRFRQLLRNAFPDYFFAEVGADRIKEFDLAPGKDYMIKPSAGLSGMVPRRIKDGAGLKNAADELRSGAEESTGSLGPDISNIETFLIEEYIRGEEMACDAFFNSKGEPVILGIYAHPLLNEDDFRDILYYTSAELVDRMLPRIEDLLRRISSRMKTQNFPMHATFRLQRNRLMPIKISPMSFGSFSLPDLNFFAFGLNPYRYYYQDRKPDWKDLLSRAEDKIFFRVLSRLQAPHEKGLHPDHDKFASVFPDLIGYCKLDAARYPAFSVAFGRAENAGEVRMYLDINFQDYIS